MWWDEELNNKWILSHSQHSLLYDSPTCDETFLNEIHFIHINSNQGFWLWPKPPILMKFPFSLLSCIPFYTFSYCYPHMRPFLSIKSSTYELTKEGRRREQEKLAPIKVDIAQYFSSLLLASLTLKEISNDTHIPWFGATQMRKKPLKAGLCVSIYKNVWINLNYFLYFYFIFIEMTKIALVDKEFLKFLTGLLSFKKEFSKFIHTKLTSEKKLMWNSFVRSQETKSIK